MRFGSVCSGAEAATLAWEPLGWTPTFYSEIAPAPRALLHHHRPDVPCHGDFTEMRGDEHGPIDVLIGGTPCQDYSLAGLRAGLDGERGNLTLAYSHLAYRSGARWLVWENVPGVFSSNGGRDFGAILATFSGRHGSVFEPPADGWRNSGIVEPADENSFGLAWRVLDAQHFGVPQRRRRVFVVGYIGNWRPPVAVLLERESMSGRAQPSRKPRSGVARTLGASTGGCSAKEQQHTFIGPDNEPLNALDDWKVGTLCADSHPGAYTGQDAYTGRLIPHPFEMPPEPADGVIYAPDVADPLICKEGETYTHEGSGNFRMRNVIAFDTTQITHPANRSNPQPGDPCHALAAAGHPPTIAFTSKDHGQDAAEDISPTLRAGNFSDSHANGGVMPAIAFQTRIARNGRGYDEDLCAALNGADAGATSDMRPCVAMPILEVGARTGVSTTDVRAGAGIGESGDPMFTLQAGKQHGVCDDYQVRRLTVVECERLQGMPDNWTRVPYRKKTITDGPRYMMIGNSMAVPVIRWIGERIVKVEEILGRSRA